jgi:hypothetical protein
MFRKIFLASLTVLVLGLSVTAARADTVVFSNFGPGMTFNTTQGYLINPAGATPPQTIAHRFTSTSNINFTSAQLALGLIAGNSNIQVFLETDAGGLPGTILETINVNISSPFPPGGIVTATSTLNTLLTAGTNYWLVAFAQNATTRAEWNFSLTDFSTANNFAFNQIPSPTGPWNAVPAGNIRSAFQINGNVIGPTVPEPATMLLFGTGLAGAVGAIRRRRKA